MHKSAPYSQYVSMRNLFYKPSISFFILLAFLVNTLGPIPSYAADEFRLPSVGMMVPLSPAIEPPILKGLKVNPDNPFQFDFILDKGDSENVIARNEMTKQSQQEQLKTQATKLIKYFLASLTIPEKDLWVNLSPYEKDRIIPQSFGLTEMGRDLLAEDYMLKQITASLIYPEDTIGKKFWKRIYEESAKRYGTTNIPVNTFNKVWIVPEKVVVYENANAGTAYVVESKLKVMLEQDYLALQRNINLPQEKNLSTSELGNQIVREIVIPELTREVNEGKNFSQLRQVYNSLILATWYKKKIKDSIIEQVYADKKKVAGVEYNNSVIPAKAGPLTGHSQELGILNVINSDKDPRFRGDDNKKDDIELIYQRYLKAFKKGVYNYIKEDIDPATQDTIPRKYFSGGVELKPSRAMLVFLNGNLPERYLPVFRKQLANSNNLIEVDSRAETFKGTNQIFRQKRKILIQPTGQLMISPSKINSAMTSQQFSNIKNQMISATLLSVEPIFGLFTVPAAMVGTIKVQYYTYELRNKIKQGVYDQGTQEILERMDNAFFNMRLIKEFGDDFLSDFGITLFFHRWFGEKSYVFNAKNLVSDLIDVMIQDRQEKAYSKAHHLLDEIAFQLRDVSFDGRDQITEKLMAIVRDKEHQSEFLRVDALDVLGKLNSPAVAEFMLGIIADDKESMSTRELALIYFNYKDEFKALDPRIVEVLSKIVKNPQEHKLHPQASHLLLTIASNQAIDALVGYAKANPEVYKESWQGMLSRLSSKRTNIPHLCSILNDGQTPDFIRGDLMFSLRAIATVESINALIKFGQEDNQIGNLARVAISQGGKDSEELSGEIVSIFMQAVQAETSPLYLREAVTVGLNKEHQNPPLINLIKNDNIPVGLRLFALKNLSNNLPAKYDLLFKFITNKNNSTKLRTEAVYHLLVYSDKKRLYYSRKIIENTEMSYEVLNEALNYLGSERNYSSDNDNNKEMVFAVSLLKKVINNPKYFDGTRSRALEKLSVIPANNQLVSPALRGVFENKKNPAEIRSLALKYLVRRDKNFDPTSLLEYIQPNEINEVRSMAVELFAGMENWQPQQRLPEVLGVLNEMLENKDYPDQNSVVKAIDLLTGVACKAYLNERDRPLRERIVSLKNAGFPVLRIFINSTLSIRQLTSEMERVVNGGMRKSNELDIALNYAHCLLILGPQNRLNDFNNFRESLIRIQNGDKELEQSLTQIGPEEELQIRGLNVEAHALWHEILAVQAAINRPLIVVGNRSYGLVPLYPITAERGRHNERYILGTNIRVIDTKIGSTESHRDELVLNKDLFSESEAQYFIEKQPVVIVVDGSTSVSDLHRTSPHIPDAHKGYRNWFMALTKALSGRIDPQDFNQDANFVQTLEQDPDFIQLVERLKGLAQGSKVSNPQGYKFGFWFPGKKDLYLRENKQKAVKVVKMMKEEDQNEKAIPVVDAQNIKGPTAVFIQSGIETEAIPENIKSGYIKGTHTPVYFDDKDHYKLFQLRYEEGFGFIPSRAFVDYSRVDFVNNLLPFLGERVPHEAIESVLNDDRQIETIVLDLDGTIALLGQDPTPEMIHRLANLLKKGKREVIVTDDTLKSARARLDGLISILPNTIRPNLFIFGNSATEGMTFDQTTGHEIPLDEYNQQSSLSHKQRADINKIISENFSGQLEIKPEEDIQRIEIKVVNRAGNSRGKIIKKLGELFKTAGLILKAYKSGSKTIRLVLKHKEDAVEFMVKKFGVDPKTMLIMADSAKSYQMDHELLARFKDAVSINVGKESDSLPDKNNFIIQLPASNRGIPAALQLLSILDIRGNLPKGRLVSSSRGIPVESDRAMLQAVDQLAIQFWGKWHEDLNRLFAGRIKGWDAVDRKSKIMNLAKMTDVDIVIALSRFKMHFPGVQFPLLTSYRATSSSVGLDLDKLQALGQRDDEAGKYAIALVQVVSRVMLRTAEISRNFDHEYLDILAPHIVRKVIAASPDNTLHKSDIFRDVMSDSVIDLAKRLYGNTSSLSYFDAYNLIVKARRDVAVRLNQKSILQAFDEQSADRRKGTGLMPMTQVTTTGRIKELHDYLRKIFDRHKLQADEFSQGVDKNGARFERISIPIVKDFTFNDDFPNELRSYRQVIIFYPDLNKFEIMHGDSAYVPFVERYLGILWKKILDKYTPVNQRYKALAEFEWWSFQIIPMMRSGAALGDAMSLVAQISSSMPLRDGFRSMDFFALSETLGGFIHFRYEDLMANENGYRINALPEVQGRGLPNRTSYAMKAHESVKNQGNNGVRREGGINLTPANMHLQTQNSSGIIKFHIDPAMLAQLKNVSGFVPVIINIGPLKNLKQFLGINTTVTS